MIHVNLEGHHFEYEILDVLKLFYADNEIILDECEPRTEYRGAFLSGRIVLCKRNFCINKDIKSRRYSSKGFRWANGAACSLQKTRCSEVKFAEYQISLESESFSYKASVPMASSKCDKDKYENRKVLKRKIKREVYLALSKFTGNSLPWGMLTGIRPAKIVHEMLEKGEQQEGIMSRLTDYYMVSRQKAGLLYNVAKVERDILDKTSPDMIGIYIGIPFCTTKCLYCSFTSNPISKYSNMVYSYVEALKSEIEGVLEIIENSRFKIQSIYIGGGTPTSLDAQMLKILLENIQDKFDLKSIQEFTLEAGRPDSIDMEKLEIIKNSQVNRISINPQTMNDKTLKLIGRNHSSEDVARTFEMARDIGFDNINMDIIVGLPGEDLSMFEYTLNRIREMNPESLTVHTMAVKRASKLNQEKDRFSLISSDEASKMIDLARVYAEEMKMHPYYLYRQKNMVGNLENIGYCRPGCESVYNIQIMEERQTIIALGAGAITKVVYPCNNRIERAFNVKSIEEYIPRVNEMINRKKVLLEEVSYGLL